jgi:LysR family transcriptional regulator, nitrogen assimilation regulatory protein
MLEREEETIKLRQLEYFQKVVEEGSISRAAAFLNVAQPALGLQIKHLEEELQVPLLVRHAKGVTPTDAGRLLYERARRIGEVVTTTKAEISALGKRRQEIIRLGLTPNVVALIGEDLLRRVGNELPGRKFVLCEEISITLVEMLERNEIDLALAYRVARRPEFVRTQVFEEELYFITTSVAAQKQGSITLLEALEHDLVMTAERSTVYHLVHKAARRAALKVNVPYLAQTTPAMLHLIRKGIASGIMPIGTALDEIRRGAVVAKRINSPAITRALYLVQSKSSPRKSREELQGFFRRTFQHPVSAMLNKTINVSDTGRA